MTGGSEHVGENSREGEQERRAASDGIDLDHFEKGHYLEERLDALLQFGKILPIKMPN